MNERHVYGVRERDNEIVSVGMWKLEEFKPVHRIRIREADLPSVAPRPGVNWDFVIGAGCYVLAGAVMVYLIALFY